MAKEKISQKHYDLVTKISHSGYTDVVREANLL